MFQRQWHSPGSQIGLESRAIRFEHSLISHDYSQSSTILSEINDNRTKDYWFRQKSRLDHLKSRSNSVLYVSFEGFWPGFDPHNNQLLDYLVLAFLDIKKPIKIVPPSGHTDINIVSCYSNQLILPANATQILFLGENVRPNFSSFDYSIGFDQFDTCDRIIYLPLWLFELDFFNKSYADRKPYPISSFVTPHNVNFKNRKDAIAFIGNNAEPFREYVLNLLLENGFTIDRYGSHTNPVENKLDILSSYKFCLCFENSYHPGYVTEKLPHSLLSGCHSIYFGCLTQEPFANHPLVLNLQPSFCVPSFISELNERRFNCQSNYLSPSICSRTWLYQFVFEAIRKLRQILLIYV